MERCRLETPVGSLTLAHDGARLHAAEFHNDPARFESSLRRFGIVCDADGDAPAWLAEPFGDYFAGAFAALDAVPLAEPAGSAFERAVWAELRRIPAGATRSYGDVARALGGRPSGHAVNARAVGTANGRNPLAVVVPCHRVIGADGALTGYAGGLERKRWLLAHEGALPRTLI